MSSRSSAHGSKVRILISTLNKKNLSMWKNVLILMTAAMTIALAGCSSDDPLSDRPSSQADFKASDVPVVLSSIAEAPYVDTRASIESDDSGNFEVNGLRIFCLATKQMENGKTFPIYWNDLSDNSYSVWLDNIAANAVMKTGSDDKLYTAINWAEGETYYYPTGNAHAYAFYGIFPKADVLSHQANRVLARTKVDGHTDFLWGAAEDTVNADAYSAKYFREHPKTKGVAQIDFKHLFMRLTFSYKAGFDSLTQSYVPATKIAIKRIQLTGVADSVVTDIADKGDHSLQGTVVSQIDTTQSYFLHDSKDAKVDSAYYPKADGSYSDIDGAFIVPVPEDGHNYGLTVTLLDTLGGKTDIVQPISVPVVLADGKKFQAGHSYDIKLTVYALKKIILEGRLEQWVIDDSAFKQTIGEVN